MTHTIPHTMGHQPWKIKVVEPLRLVDPSQRKRALADAGYNTFLLRSDDVYIDPSSPTVERTR